jgi:hypothetical protein
MSEVGLDRPEQGSEVQVIPITRGIALDAQVEHADATTLVVRVDNTELAEELAIDRGDRIEVFWRTLELGRALPAEVVEVEPGPGVRWQLRILGPTEPSQRRRAVRAHVELPARARLNAVEISGETIDLSEAGSRALFDGWGLPRRPGRSRTSSSSSRTARSSRRHESYEPSCAARAG